MGCNVGVPVNVLTGLSFTFIVGDRVGIPVFADKVVEGIDEEPTIGLGRAGISVVTVQPEGSVVPVGLVIAKLGEKVKTPSNMDGDGVNVGNDTNSPVGLFVEVGMGDVDGMKLAKSMGIPKAGC